MTSPLAAYLSVLRDPSASLDDRLEAHATFLELNWNSGGPTHMRAKGDTGPGTLIMDHTPIEHRLMAIEAALADLCRAAAPKPPGCRDTLELMLSESTSFYGRKTSVKAYLDRRHGPVARFGWSGVGEVAGSESLTFVKK